MVATPQVDHPYLRLTHPQSLVLRICFHTVSQILPHLIQPRLVRHLRECSPDDKDFRALAPDLKLVEPENEDQDNLDLLLLVADVVGDILNKEEDGSPEEMARG